MKSILSAAVLFVAISGPALAEEATSQTQPAPLVVILPTATTPAPAMTEAPVTLVEEETQSKAAMGGHGCASKKAVYLTN